MGVLVAIHRYVGFKGDLISKKRNLQRKLNREWMGAVKIPRYDIYGDAKKPN
jgi:hypothetical protein